ncbi:predicted protein [Aspergillus nidulans FGSC A4]|uniref:Uncharacterized protein n=1 Tax=Emericella nidulans (strain FGSC A4 / ATCC 38163 / CBS 112.46 / NRRL 194 / M139) TaxID=227321 RepID=Q5AZW7_EMENI|nr:hypothetical protein [Aspergillus nidulans FGSC A4]EAA57949.1 predicted protein [Aspergillus nidulans FGSC A4]CBF70059.1 TPA: conserved hypothetical protein [Aspergillus nidulans FGSC A4]|eukprot:XP_663767.1 predicted protein [Aspergillus nidulans FGSC A4]
MSSLMKSRGWSIIYHLEANRLQDSPTLTGKRSRASMRTLVTTLPAPITAPSPIVTPGSTVTFPANQQSSPIWISFPDSGPDVPLRKSGSRGCVPLYKLTLGPNRVRAPMVTRRVSIMTQS